MSHTPEVQALIDDPFGGHTAEELRQLCSTDLARRALAHPPLAFLIDKFCAEYGYAEADARELFEETKRFLVVGRLADQLLAPSLPVDRMWHSFILFTKDYHDFCDLLGGYIHHRPIPSGSPEQPPIEPTAAIMEAAFGALSPVYWPQELGAFGGMDCKKGP